MKHKFLLFASMLATVFLIAMMNLVTPQNVGPFGVLVFFTMLYIVCLGLGVCLVEGWSFMRKKMFNVGAIYQKRVYYYGAVLGFAPVIIIAMGSFGAMRSVSILLVGILMFLGCFLISKRF